MQTKSTLTLALTLGVVFAAPAFAQQSGACIHMQTSCSDAPYPVTQSGARTSHRRLYNMVQPQVAVPQQNPIPVCIHAQTSCL
jgi:hypothetical protein